MAVNRGPVFFTLAAALVVAAASLFSVDVAGAAEAAPSWPKHPNIVLVVTDDQGYGDFSCHGNPILKTPNLDRLHAESVRFTDFHVSPTCSPTRASLMTGRHEFRSGVTHTIYERERLGLSATTLPQVLKTAGYVNGIFGKWHLGDEAEYQPNRRGFDEVFIHGGGGIGQTYVGSCGDAPKNKYFDPAILHNGKFEKTKGYCTDIFFAEAQKWITSRVKAPADAAAPFFCYIATNAPHGPLNCPPEYEAKYAKLVKTPDEAKFFGMVANIDDNVGRLLAKLGELGIERETLVIFMNDNGGTVGTRIFNAGMRGQKVTPYRGGTRAASFWRLPGAFEPGDCDRLAAHIDIFPTLAELAGAKISGDLAAKFDGRSLVPLLKDHQAEWADRILFTHVGRWPKGSDPNDAKFGNCSIRDPRWNLVSSPRKALVNKPKPGEALAGREPQWELFDLKADPGEAKNVAAENPDVVARLAKAYDAWWVKVVPATLENDRAVGPAINPFHALYYAQFGGGPADPKPTPPAK
jgi:arylsulfatase A-like enzyme